MDTPTGISFVIRSFGTYYLNSYTKMDVIYSQFSRAEEVPEPLYLVSVWLRSTSRTSILERYFYEKANNTLTPSGNKTFINVKHMELVVNMAFHWL